ncbi:MAG: sigma 54-interacting transcriptional regulator, partial [Candidatus Cloacimonas sp.]|nr:sigma 54-interacting transcriptional regulator [Candidatus Cloacimonadota bacterium]
IEIIGGSGSGKTHLYQKLCKNLVSEDYTLHQYAPSIIEVNQFKALSMLIFDLTDSEYNDLVEGAKILSTDSRYDFFFFITEQLRQQGKIKSKVIVIDNCDLLDRYTLDFLQYYVQYAAEERVHFIGLTSEELFPFSEKIKLDYLSYSDILLVLKDIFEQDEAELKTQSELLFTLSHGNIYIIEHLIRDFVKTNKSTNFNLTSYLDKQVDLTTIYYNELAELSKADKQALYAVFLLDRQATEENVYDYLSKSDKKLTKKSLNETLDKLIGDDFMEDNGPIYRIKKLRPFRDFFLELSTEERNKIYETVSKFHKELHKDSKLDLSSYQVGLHLFDPEYNSITEDAFVTMRDYLERINEYDKVLEISEFIIELSKTDEKKIKALLKAGVICKHSLKFEESAQYFREALRISSEISAPIEEIVFELADSLYKLNSFAYALEMIKKYQAEYKDKYWTAKLLLMQGEINIDSNNDTEAREIVEQLYELYPEIEDQDKKQFILAETKKLLGKVYYYTNQWDKAEGAFKEAGKIFQALNDIAGLAAIDNNLGVLKMYRGDWKETEELFLQSLELERQRYSLDGVSICYNNLGGLWEDRGDYVKSLDYFNEALKIKKLLSDRYNICNIYNNIGVTYMDNGEFEKAGEAFEKTMEVARNFNLFKNLIAALNNLGALYFKSGKWSKAIDCYEEAIERSKKDKFLDGLSKSYNNLGELYERRGEYELAHDFYFKASSLVEELNDEYQKAEIWGNLGSVLTNLLNFSDAYRYLVESLDFFKTLNANDKIIEGCQKMANYFIMTRNQESATYYLEEALTKAQESNNTYEIGRTYFIKGQLDKKNPKEAQESFEKAIKIFVETKNYYELALANYEYASILFDNKDWQQALEILNNNKKILKEYGAISLIEKNDLFIQKIEKTHYPEIQESKRHETLLEKFYEITQNMKSITNFNTLLDYTLDSFVELSEGDGGIICLYNNAKVGLDTWEYKLFNNYSPDDKVYDNMMEIVGKTFQDGKALNYKQPHFAAQYNNIVSFPLTIHDQTLGVILLFSKHGSHYFSERITNLLNALSNQAVVIIEHYRNASLSKTHETIRGELSEPQIFTNIIGKSERIQDIFNIIEKVKDVPTTILIEGPSGTGKELIARAIHYNSVRKNKQFVAQYCGSLPETLLESELFGHVKGSFTGATHDKKGLFEIADGGTFFLDEIADISLSTQAKLLRFLQEGEIKRVGSTKTQHVDVRVICATNVPLKKKIDSGEFRLDLYYRLNVIKIEVPSLTERKSDIPLLSVHFLDKYNKKMNKNIKGITDEAMNVFMESEWPGNIRQLENEIERAVTLVEEDSYIKPSDLSEEVIRYAAEREEKANEPPRSLKEAVEELEKDMIREAIVRNKWNQTQTAKELGLSRQGLIQKLKRYGLDKEE